jgi:excinuclease UvrABC nuclease subunit
MGVAAFVLERRHEMGGKLRQGNYSSDRLREAVKDLGPDQGGMYALRGKGGEVLYVGQSEDVQSRVRSHVAKPRGGEIDDFDYFPAEQGERGALERFFIGLLGPRDNRQR